MAHALLAPSAAARWSRCPASVPFTADLPVGDTSTRYTQEGTWAHRLAEIRLKGGDCFSREELMAIEEQGFTVSDFDEPVSVYVDFVRSLGGQLFVEQQLDISCMTGEEGAKGTADAVVYRDGELYICDLKYGQGEKVDAEANPQLSMYAVAAYDALAPLLDEIKTVSLVIVQPRLGHISQWAMTVEVMEDFRRGIMAAADEVRWELNCDVADRTATWRFRPCYEACRFCPARHNCRALSQWCMTAAGFPLSSSFSPAVTGDDVSEVLGHLDLIEKWLADYKEWAVNCMLAGLSVPGYKVVRGREGNRAWTDDKEADKLLKAAKVPADERYVRKLISPAGLDRLLKSGKLSEEAAAELQSLVTRAPGKPTIAPVTDKRPEYQAPEPEFPEVKAG